MFRVILATQWKWMRGMLLLATCAAFGLPFLALHNASRALDELNARSVLSSMEVFGPSYALAAAFTGLMVAAMSWTPDHAGRHVYALSLPIRRWKYVAMRFGAGALVLSAPTIALWLGGAIALAFTPIPPGLHSHPVALAFRFALAALVAYAIFFAISSGTKRTAALLVAVLIGLVFIDIAGGMIGLRFSPAAAVFEALVGWSGTMGVFNGRWMLIDV